MNVLVNDKVVSCDKKIKAMLKAKGFKTTKSDSVDVMQFRNSVTTLSTQVRVITENDYDSVISEVISQAK